MAMAAFFAVFLFVPFFCLLRHSFIIHDPEMMTVVGSSLGQFTAHHLQSVFSDPQLSLELFYVPLAHTLTMMGGSFLVALALGAAGSWLLSHAAASQRNILFPLLSLSFARPSWLLALAWENMVGRWGALLPAWVCYGAFPIAIIMGIHFTPLVVLARQASRHRFSRMLPLLALSIGSEAIGSFATPTILGSPVRYHVLATQISTTVLGLKPGYGYLLSSIMLALAALLFACRNRARLRLEASPEEAEAGRRSFRWCGWLLLALVAPPLVLPVFSFLLHCRGVERGAFLRLFAGGCGTVGVALCAAFLCLVLGILCAFALDGRGRSDRFLRLLAGMPVCVPPLVVGVMYHAVFSPLLTSAFWRYVAFVCAALLQFLPSSFLLALRLKRAVPAESIEAGAMLALPWPAALWRYAVRPRWREFRLCLYLPFVKAVEEMSLFVILAGSEGDGVLATLLFHSYEIQWGSAGNLFALGQLALGDLAFCLARIPAAEWVREGA